MNNNAGTKVSEEEEMTRPEEPKGMKGGFSDHMDSANIVFFHKKGVKFVFLRIVAGCSVLSCGWCLLYFFILHPIIWGALRENGC